MVRHYMKIAFRNLWRYKVQNLIGIVGLAVGFLCFSFCSYLFQDYNLKDTEFPGAGRMYVLETKYSSVYDGNIVSLMENFQEVEAIAMALNPCGYTMFPEVDHLPAYSHLVLMDVDTNFLDFFSLEIIVGTPLSVNSTQNSIVLFEEKALELSANINELPGQTVRLSDEKEYIITGVLKKPRNSSIMQPIGYDGLIINRSDAYLSFEVKEHWDPRELRYTFILLKQGVSETKFQEQLHAMPVHMKIDESRLGYIVTENNEIIKKTVEEKTDQFYLRSLSQIGKNERETRRYAGIFVVGLLIFLMTLFNYVSFQTALFYNRLRECAVRKVNGAGIKQIYLLFFSEIVIALCFAFILCFALLRWIRPFLQETILFRDVQFNGLRESMLFYLLVVLVLSFVFCFISARIIDRRSIRSVLLGLFEKKSKNFGHIALLFVQMIILLVFMSSSIIISMQINKTKSNILEQIPAEEQKRILSLSYTKERISGQQDAIVAQLKESLLFTDVSMESEHILSSGESQIYAPIRLDNEERKEWFYVCPVSPDFFDFFRCQLLSGRFFDDNSAPGDVVINKSFADLYGTKDPIGETFSNYRIVGVINDPGAHIQRDRFSSGKPAAFFVNQKYLQKAYHFVFYGKVVSGKEQEARIFMEDVVKSILPEEYRDGIHADFLNESIDYILSYERELLSSFTLLFVISLVIGLLSIYSAVAMSAERRRKEVAVRKINGAGLYDIILLFFKNYFILWTTVCLFAFPFVYHYANEWLERYIERVSLNLLFFVSLYLVVAILILLTILYKVLSVAQINPVEELKRE